MRDKRLKIFLRRHLDADQFRKARDADLWDAIVEEVDSRWLSRQDTGAIQDFLEWLLDHADEILAVVIKIIGLFGSES